MLLMPDAGIGAVLHAFHPDRFLAIDRAIGQCPVFRAIDMRLLMFQPGGFARGDRPLFDSAVDPRFLSVLSVVDAGFHAIGRGGLSECRGAEGKGEQGGVWKGFHGGLQKIGGVRMHRLHRLNAARPPVLTLPACKRM